MIRTGRRARAAAVSLAALAGSLLAAAPASAAPAMTGWWDSVTFTGMSMSVSGWGCAPSDRFKPLRVDVYNGSSFERYLGSLPVNQLRPDAAPHCGGHPYVGFSGSVASVCLQPGTAVYTDVRVYLVHSDAPPVHVQFPRATEPFSFGCG